MDMLISSKTLQTQAYEVILDAICDGTLEPGQRLTQEDVAKRLNVSRQPILSAFSTLKAQGFVQETGRRGLAVAPLNERFFKEIYEFRSAVEPLAVRLAIANLDERTIASGRALIERGHALAAAEDINGLLKADTDFHSFIYTVAGNSLIVETMRLNWAHLRRCMREVLRLPHFLRGVWVEHEAILSAMERGDATAACAIMSDHLSAASESVLPALEAKAAHAKLSGGA